LFPGVRFGNKPLGVVPQKKARAILSAARAGREKLLSQAAGISPVGRRRGAPFRNPDGGGHVVAVAPAALTALDRNEGAATMRTSSMKLLRYLPVLAVAICVPAFSHADVADGIKAVVNDRAITYAEVEDYARDAANALRQQYPAQPEVFQQKLNELLNDSLDQLVERQLILHSFDSEGYKLPDSALDQVVQERIREQFGDRVSLMKTLQARGMTFEQFRQQIRDQYIASALRNQNVQREVIISPTKVLDYYQNHQDNFKIEDQVKLRMIVLNKASPDDASPVNFAREIQAKLKDGATFSEMASIYSQGSQQHQGGDWGWVERSVLRKDLADVAFSLAPGQTSDPINTTDAIYLMLVEDKKTAHAKPLADVRGEIEKTLRTQEQAKLQKQWIDGLKKKTFIRYF
jgi:peptidyl-prolyl cis-trans isomerase SurA